MEILFCSWWVFRAMYDVEIKAEGRWVMRSNRRLRSSQKCLDYKADFTFNQVGQKFGKSTILFPAGLLCMHPGSYSACASTGTKLSAFMDARNCSVRWRWTMGVLSFLLNMLLTAGFVDSVVLTWLCELVITVSQMLTASLHQELQSTTGFHRWWRVLPWTSVATKYLKSGQS